MSLRALSLSCLAAAAVAPTAQAAEVQFEGYYRARMRLADSLSLDRTLATNEGLTWYAQHRLWLRPKLLLSDKAAVFVGIRALDGVYWGDQPATYPSPVANAAPAFDDGLTAPTSDTDSTTPLSDITLWRAWAETYTKIGRFKVGRMPVHWGTGMWLNDGTSVNPLYADYGDTVDRVSWELLVQDSFWVHAAADVTAENLVNERDDTTAWNLGVAYRNEVVAAGLLTRYQHTSNADANGRFNLFSVDITSEAELGKLNVEGEFIGQFGGGALPEIGEGVSVTAFGALIDAEIDLEPFKGGFTFGLATGDGDSNDLRLKTFTFDRDYSVGLFLFEQPMPTLATITPTDANGGRSSEETLLGNAVGNAIFFKPRISRTLIPGWRADLSFLGARVAKVPASFEGRRSYGMEFGAGVHFDGIEHVDLGLDLGAFVPGSYFREFRGDLGARYDDAVFGGQLGLRVHF
ncbi:MAG: hypothetical protein ACI8PZ_002061 [Myxococcota bacterium]